MKHVLTEFITAHGLVYELRKYQSRRFPDMVRVYAGRKEIGFPHPSLHAARQYVKQLGERARGDD
jgi:hypothetical protein